MSAVVYFIVVLTLAALVGGQVRHTIMLYGVSQVSMLDKKPDPYPNISVLSPSDFGDFNRMVVSFGKTSLKCLCMDSNCYYSSCFGLK